MLRRSFLATAAVAPALYAGKAPACIDQKPFGSSVPPLGKMPPVSPNRGCVNQAPDPDKMVNWSPSTWRSTVDYYSSYWASGQVALPANTLARYSLDDPLYQAQFTPGQYMDWRDLANMVGVAAGVDAVAANRSYAYRNGWFMGGALAAWVGWNTGTFIHLNAVGVDAFIRTNLGPASWIGAVADGPSREVLSNNIYGGASGGHVILIIRLR